MTAKEYTPHEYAAREMAGMVADAFGDSIAVGETAPWSGRLRASNGPLLRNGGRTVLLLLSSFVVLTNGRSALVALADAGLAAIVWSVACQRMVGAARIKQIAFGGAATTIAGVAAGFVVLAAAAFVVPRAELAPETLIVMSLLAALVVTVWEALLDRVGTARSRLLIVGTAPWGIELLERIAASPKLRFDVIGLVDDEHEGEQVAGVPVQGKISDLADVVKREQPDLVVIAVNQGRPEVFAQLLEAAEEKFSVLGMPEFYEQAFGQLPIRALTPAWFMSVLHLYQTPYTRVAKRTFDLVFATIGLIVLLPLFPLIALLVRLTPGPSIYRQTRLGSEGKPFTILKFRTMAVDAEAAGHAWAIERDPRINRFGQILRKTRLDEIPQLWNVIKGDMSIVGPRPERPEYLAELTAAVPYWTSRHLLKPGITGWAQVSDGYASDVESTERKLSYDLWYLRHRSLAIDLLVCARTVSKLTSGSGAR